MAVDVFLMTGMATTSTRNYRRAAQSLAKEGNACMTSAINAKVGIQPNAPSAVGAQHVSIRHAAVQKSIASKEIVHEIQIV